MANTSEQKIRNSNFLEKKISILSLSQKMEKTWDQKKIEFLFFQSEKKIYNFKLQPKHEKNVGTKNSNFHFLRVNKLQF